MFLAQHSFVFKYVLMYGIGKWLSKITQGSKRCHLYRYKVYNKPWTALVFFHHSTHRCNDNIFTCASLIIIVPNHTIYNLPPIGPWFAIRLKSPRRILQITKKNVWASLNLKPDAHHFFFDWDSWHMWFSCQMG